MKKDIIQQNMESDDEFVKNLYTDVDERVNSYEQKENQVEKMKLKDSFGTCVIAAAIIGVLIFVGV